MTFLAIAAGAALGSFLGNTLVFVVIGVMAARTEKKKLQEFQQLQQQMQEAVRQENERMQRYAKMEG